MTDDPPSALGGYLRAEIDRRGITDERFAEMAGLTKSSLSNILHTPGIVPKLTTLAGIAHGLDMPLGRLIEICGFQIGRPDPVANAELIGTMISQVPELRGLVDHLLPLPAEHLHAIEMYVRYYLEQQVERRGA